MTAEILSRSRLYSGWLKLDQVALRMPDGEVVQRHLEDHGPAVAVLPYDPERRIAILVTQPRTPVLAAGEPPVLEAPAGMIETDGTEASARRELLEEAGIRASVLDPVANIWTLIPISSERIQLYLASFGEDDRIASGGGAHDENEAIDVVEVPLAALAAMVRAGTLTDAKTLILAQRLMLDRPELFV